MTTSTRRGATSDRLRIPHIHPRGSEAGISSLGASRRSELLAALAPIGPLRVDRVDLPGTTESLIISRPVDYDRLIDDAAADPEQNLPYWAELWPSGITLAEAAAGVTGTVLELGCGLGLPSLVAALDGADVVATDWSADAIALLERNAARVDAPLRALRWSWTEPAPISSSPTTHPRRSTSVRSTPSTRLGRNPRRSA